MSMWLNRVRTSLASSPGTGPFALGAADAGYLGWAAAGADDGGEVTYLAEESGTKWEVGRGVWDATSNTLTRHEILRSSAALVGGQPQKETFSSSAKVGSTVAAEDLDYNFCMSVSAR